MVERWRSRPELFASLALGAVYAALMSGHLESFDGLMMYRQATAVLYDHSLTFPQPLWLGTPYATSKYGIGLSLLYLPSLLLLAWLRAAMPLPLPNGLNYWSLLYGDPLYTAAGAPVHVVLAAVSAYLVARLIFLLGFERRVALWGLAVYGLASPALVYARGDWAQTLEGLCWIGAIYAAIRARQSGSRRALLACGGLLGYAVLTRAVEGSLLLPALLLLAVPDLRVRSWPRAIWRFVATLALSYGAAVGITLLVNWARYGSPLDFGYAGEGWTNPLLVGLAGALVSPGRGIFWAFPAAILFPTGMVLLRRRGQGRMAVALCAIVVLQLLNVAAWHAWWGGWDWGLRLFLPALPLLAVGAAAGMAALPGPVRPWLSALLFGGGIAWVIPCVVTDLAGGFARMTDGTDAGFSWSAYPPVGAWQFLTHTLSQGTLDFNAVDILWFRLAAQTNDLSLIPFGAFLLTAVVFAGGAHRALSHCERAAGTRREARVPAHQIG